MVFGGGRGGVRPPYIIGIRPVAADDPVAAPSAPGVSHVCSAARYEPVRAVSSFSKRVRWRWVRSSRNLTKSSRQFVERVRRWRYSPASAFCIIACARPTTRRAPTTEVSPACERGAGRTPQPGALVVGAFESGSQATPDLDRHTPGDQVGSRRRKVPYRYRWPQPAYARKHTEWCRPSMIHLADLDRHTPGDRSDVKVLADDHGVVNLLTAPVRRPPVHAVYVLVTG